MRITARPKVKYATYIFLSVPTVLSHYYLAADVVEAARRLFITLHCHAVVVWHATTLQIGHRH